MGWFTPVLDLTVNHTLGCDTAREKLQLWALDFKRKNSNPNITIEDAHWIGAGQTLNLILKVYQREVHATAVVAPGYVHVSTDPLPLYCLPFVKYAQSLLNTELTKALT